MSADFGGSASLAALGRGRVAVGLGDGRYLARQVAVARGPLPRFLGLMGRRQLGPEEGLWLVPCRSIHMFFMRAEIDVVFLDRAGTVVRTARMRPWSLRPISVTLLPVAGAHSVLELAPGRVEALGLVSGSRLTFEPEGAPTESPALSLRAPSSSISTSGE